MIVRKYYSILAAIPMGISVFFGAPFVVLNFSLGLICGKVFSKLSFAKFKFTFAIIFIALLPVCVYLWTHRDLLQNDDTLVSIVINLIVLSAASAHQFKLRLLTNLGDASYSLYLVQVISLPVIFFAFSKLPAEISFANLEACLALVGTIVSGWLLYIFLDRPLQSRFKSQPKSKITPL